MGCNCGGRPNQQAATDLRHDGVPRERVARDPERRPGGPGQPGYTWNGPQRPPQATPPNGPSETL